MSSPCFFYYKPFFNLLTCVFFNSTAISLLQLASCLLHLTFQLDEKLVGLKFDPRIQKGTFQIHKSFKLRKRLCFGVALAEDLLCTHKSHTYSSHKEKAKRDLYWVAWYRLREQLLKTNQTSTLSILISLLRGNFLRQFYPS